MKPQRPRREPPRVTIGDALNWAAVKAEQAKVEAEKKRRAELDAMGFKGPQEKP